MQGALNALITVFTTPMTAAAATVIYFDLRVRKEGFDIALMVQRLDAVPVRAHSGPTTFPAPTAVPATDVSWSAPVPWPPPDTTPAPPRSPTSPRSPASPRSPWADDPPPAPDRPA